MDYVLYFQGREGLPCLSLVALVVASCAISGYVQMIYGALLWILLLDLAFLPWMWKGLGRGEGFAWTWGHMARLPKYFDPGAVFSLRVLEAYTVHRYPGPWMHRCVALVTQFSYFYVQVIVILLIHKSIIYISSTIAIMLIIFCLLP